MNKENMKNMVVLKDLPSNIVDEAIIILKPNVKIKKTNKIDQNNKSNKKAGKIDTKKYIVNEAEMLVSNYISKIENDRNKDIKVNKKMEKKYKRLKAISFALGILLLLTLLIR